MSETLVAAPYTIAEENSARTYILPSSQRDEAKHVLETTDFPTSRTEAWKYTRVAKIKNTSFKTLDESRKIQDLSPFLVPGLTGSVLVFVNGFYASELSRIKAENGLEVSALSENTALQAELGKLVPLENEVFSSLNTLYAQDGVAIRIAKKAVVEQSVQVIFINTGAQAYSGNRNLIICEDFASAHVVFNYVSLNAETCFTNSISEIYTGTNAHLKIDKIQQESVSNFNILSEFVDQAKDSVFTINTITLDGGLVRNNLTINVEGQNCETNLSGAYILKGKQHVDNHTVVDHKVAHCLSNELYKGVIDDQSTAVFNGKVFVRKDAQKINAFQSNGNVLLSDSATANSKPELEIYADDVKCSHGSTTGQLDEEAVFYLRARGLSEKSARALMVSAFIGDVIEKIENDAVREYVDALIEEKFGWVK
ncbi:MAG: sufD [Crocinitomicaceae bacterium]|jgi:Fe-S cluster assembly protein SufD|nr:sufD [Crocinitomicaceae bacterium]